MATTTVTYLFIRDRWIFFTTPTLIFEKLQNKVSRAGASKNKERERREAQEGSAALWNLVLDSQFPPEVANVEQGR
jgi:hypothetical protein